MLTSTEDPSFRAIIYPARVNEAKDVPRAEMIPKGRLPILSSTTQETMEKINLMTAVTTAAK